MCVKLYRIQQWLTEMSEARVTSNLVLLIVEGVIALVAAGAIAYSGMLNSEIDRLNKVIAETELRLSSELGRIRQDVDAIARDQKLTIEKLHAEYCGIQKSLADINVAVTALNSRLLSRDDVEKIARREAVMYHQSCERPKKP